MHKRLVVLGEVHEHDIIQEFGFLSVSRHLIGVVCLGEKEDDFSFFALEKNSWLFWRGTETDLDHLRFVASRPSHLSGHSDVELGRRRNDCDEKFRRALREHRGEKPLEGERFVQVANFSKYGAEFWNTLSRHESYISRNKSS